MALVRVTLVAAVLFSESAWSWSCNDVESPTNATLSYRSLSDVDSAAVCNDGSAAGYYIEKGVNPNLWMVYLGGGSWCYDEASCAARWESGCPQSYSNEEDKVSCMSNESFVDSCSKSGVFDRDVEKNPALAGASLIYVPYCTSDAHMGDAAASDETFGWHFRGARVVRAVISDLVATQGLGGAGSSSSPSSSSSAVDEAPGRARLVFGGGSAGARGAMVLLDEVSETLSASSVEVVGFLDSPMIMDVAPLNDSFSGFAYEHQQVYAVANAASVVPADCAALYGRGLEWRCLMGQYRLPLVRASLATVAFQFDSYQLDYNIWAGDSASGGGVDDLDDAQETYVETFGVAARTLLGGLAATTVNVPLERRRQLATKKQLRGATTSTTTTMTTMTTTMTTQQQQQQQQQQQRRRRQQGRRPGEEPPEYAGFGTRAVFMPGCWNHHQSENSNFWTITAAAYAPWAEASNTMAGFLQLFLRDDDSADVWMDSCATVNCGDGCSV